MQQQIWMPSKSVEAFDSLIEQAKKRVADARQRLEAMQPKLKELDEALRKASKEYYDYKALTEELKFGIEKEIGCIKILKERKHKASAGKVEWLAEASSILRTENKFMTAKELWQKVTAIPEVKRSLFFMKHPPTLDQFYKKLFNAASAAMNTRSLVAFEDGFGLPSWVDAEGNPIDSYGDRFKFATVLKPKREF